MAWKKVHSLFFPLHILKSLLSAQFRIKFHNIINNFGGWKSDWLMNSNGGNVLRDHNIVYKKKKAHPDLSESQLCSVRLQASCMRRISFITDNPGETLRAQRAWQHFLQLVAHTATPWERFSRDATQTEIENKKKMKKNFRNSFV